MHIDSYFAISNSNLDDAEFVLFGIPYDQSQSFISGSRFAPNAVRVASWNLESHSPFFDFDLDFAKVCDAGNINVDGNFQNILINVEKFFQNIKGKIPIGIGGEHTISYAIVRNLEVDCYLVIDAHLDLRDEFDGSKFNHACTCRRISDLGLDIIYLGVRSYTREEMDYAKEKGFKIFNPFNVDIEKIGDLLSPYDKIYFSIDFDGFDPAYATVSTPEPFGLNPSIVLEIFENFANKIVGMDISEIVPDISYKTPILGARIIQEFIASKSLSSTPKL